MNDSVYSFKQFNYGRQVSFSWDQEISVKSLITWKSPHSKFSIFCDEGTICFPILFVIAEILCKIIYLCQSFSIVYLANVNCRCFCCCLLNNMNTFKAVFRLLLLLILESCMYKYYYDDPYGCLSLGLCSLLSFKEIYFA